MRKFVGLIIVLLSPSQIFGQNFFSDFQKYLKSNDTINQLKTLEEWKINASNDPELFTCYFNYYYMKSINKIVAITSQKPEVESFPVKDSLKQKVGYIGSQVQFQFDELQKGIDKINQGISLYPNRLDMRFGEIYVYGQIKDWESFTNKIIMSIKQSSLNNNNWTWTKNEIRKDGKEFFLGNIQSYQNQLYNIGDDSLLLNMRNIANEVLKYYPNNVESLSNLSVTYLIKGEYDKGLEPLLKSEKINPKDYIILANIAQGYKMKGNKNKAIEYYEKVIKYGDDDMKDMAKQQIEELKKIKTYH